MKSIFLFQNIVFFFQLLLLFILVLELLLQFFIFFLFWARIYLFCVLLFCVFLIWFKCVLKQSFWNMKWVNSTFFIINFELFVLWNQHIHLRLGWECVVANGVLTYFTIKNYHNEIKIKRLNLPLFGTDELFGNIWNI